MINGSGLQPTFWNVVAGIAGSVLGSWASRQIFGSGRRGGGAPQPPNPFWMENPMVLIALAKAIEEIDRSKADLGKQFLLTLGTPSNYDKQLGNQISQLLGQTGGK